MKLLEFQPYGYRSLSEAPIYFTFAEEEPAGKRCSIRFLAGLNGTGKSTLLRFLAAIFAALDEGYQRDHPENPAYGVPFRLRYRLRDNTVEIRAAGGGRARLEFRINGVRYEGMPGGDQILPEALLIYTSGDIGLWRALLYGRTRYATEGDGELPDALVFDEEDGAELEVSDVSQEETLSTASGMVPGDELIQSHGWLSLGDTEEVGADEGSVFSRITLIETAHLPLAFLVACLAQVAEQEQNLSLGPDFRTVMKHVRLDRLVSFSLRLSYNPDRLSEAQRRRLRRLAAGATVTLNLSGTWLWVYDIDDLREGQGPATRLMPDLALNPGQPYQLFQDLIRLHEDSVRAAQLPLENRPLELLEVNQVVNKPTQYDGEHRDQLLLFTDLSDGEQAYLTRIALIHLLGKRESLFLLDEPETHFNDDWKRNLVDQIERTLDGSESQVILTTHASIVLTDAYPEEVILLNEDGQQSVPLTFAAEQNELLRSVFGADRSVGRRAIDRVNALIQDGTVDELHNLLDQVGPGYFRYKIIEALERRVSQDQRS